MASQLQLFAQIFTDRLLNTATAGFVLVSLVWVLLHLAGRQNSGTRFAIWFSSLLAIAALPFVPWSGLGAINLDAIHPVNLRGQLVLSASVALYLFVAWAAGAGLLLLRLGVGLWRVRLLRNRCSDVDLSADPEIAGILREFESRRRVRLCVSSEAAVPAAIGFFRPAIVFPAWLLPQLSSTEINTVVRHELAHLRRCDDWTNLAQQVVKALFFFHPAVWWIENRLTLEREMACDEIVLAQTASPRAYASSLISFAERLQSARGLALAQALVSRMHQMSLRVAQILDAKRPNRTGLSRPVMGMSAAIVAIVLGAAPYLPRVVAFQTRPGLSPIQQVQAARNVTVSPEQRTVAAMTHVIPQQVALRSKLPAQPRAIPATFHPRKIQVPLRSKATATNRPAVVLTRTSQEVLPIQETIFILRTTQYDASGSGVWTLCIWRVGGANQAARQLESAIFVSSI